MRKAFLATEILLTYGVTRRQAPQRDLRVLVRDARGAHRQPAVIRASAAREDLMFALRLGRAVSRTLGIVPTDSRCLLESLVLIRLLSRRGIAGTLVVGTRSSPAFAAHAWVECTGTPLLPTAGFADSRLAEF